MPTLLKNSAITTPSQEFVDEFNQLFKISLLDGNWHDRMFSLQHGTFMFNQMKFDRHLSKLDPDYDFDEATYKGESISMGGYLKMKYGGRADAMVDYLCQNQDGFETEFAYTEG